MESWQKVWREGIAPLLSVSGLKALRDALKNDDPTLIQGTTVVPMLLSRDVAEACPIAYAGWKGDGLRTVDEIDEFFGRMCYEIDLAVGDPEGCRWFLNWVDDTPRDEMRRLLLAEVERSLNTRTARPCMNGQEIEQEFAGLKLDWADLAKRFIAAIRTAGGPYKPSEGFFLDLNNEVTVQLGTYSIGNWPRSLVKSFSCESEAHSWTKEIVEHAEKEVSCSVI
jgi:hypothetical protein